jgi:hypothetical protein
MKPKLLLLLLGLIMSQVIISQKIFPGAVGYGTDSRGAYGGTSEPTILIVDTLSPGYFSTGTNRGTFAWCVSRPFPRIILFEVSGYIDYTGINKEILIENPYFWVAGQSAPAPGICIKSTSLHIRNTHDGLIQHIKVRAGDDTTGLDPCEMDAFLINNSKKIVVDHCTFSWGADDNVGIGKSDSVTFSNCLIYEALNRSFHYDETIHHPEKHPMGLFINSCSNFTFYNSLSGYAGDRVLWLRSSGNYIVINNLFYNPAYHPGPTYGASGNVVNVAGVGNVTLFPPPWNNSNSTYSCRTKTGTSTSSKIYLSDNLCQRKIDSPESTEWDNFNNGSNLPGLATTSPIDISEFYIRPSSEVEEYVLNNAGCRYQDASDIRIIDQIQSRAESFLIDSPDPLSARIYNDFSDVYKTDGDMTNGHDWSGANNESFTINGKIINLTKNCATLQEVMSHIQPQLPDNLEAYKVWGTNYLGIKTKATGSSQKITVTENQTLGIFEGTYYGSDGVGGFPELQINHSTVESMPDYPAGSLHGDDNSNGYTNIEEWLYMLGSGNSIRNINNKPQINNQQFSICDTLGIGEKIGKIVAVDNDYGQTLTFSITDGNPNNRYNIDALTGNLFINNTVNISEDEKDNLLVQVMDNGEGNLKASATITINIEHFVRANQST